MLDGVGVPAGLVTPDAALALDAAVAPDGEPVPLMGGRVPDWLAD